MTQEELDKIARRYAQDELKDNHGQVENIVAAAFLNGIDYAENHPHWISVEDELPEDNEWVLCYDNIDRCVSLLRYDGNRWWDDDGYGVDKRVITHWMPLPQPPAVISNLERTEKRWVRIEYGK